MVKQPIGPRHLTAVIDSTGNNAGNWTISFDPATMAMHWSMYEVYKIVVNVNQSAGVVPFTVYIGQRQYEAFQTSVVASWSDTVPMIVDGGETLYFYFTEPATDGTPPSVTIWCQVDRDLAKRT